MEEALILQKLRELYGRYRLSSGWVTILRFLFPALIISALYLTFVKLTGFFVYYLHFFIIPIIAGLFAGYVFHAFRKTTLLKVALLTDEKLNLSERLSTVVEWIEKGKKRQPMFLGLLRQTAQKAKRISAKEVFPIDVKKPLIKIFGAGMLLAVLFFVPSLSLFTPKVTMEEVKIISKEAENIEKLALQIQKKTPRSNLYAGDLKKASESLKKLSSDMKKPAIGKRQAIAKISAVRDTLQQSLKRKEEMERLARLLKNAENSKSSEDSASSRDAFKKMSEKLKKLSDKVGKGGQSKVEKQKTEEDLWKIRESMTKSGMDTDKIYKAIEEYKKGNKDSAARELSKLASEMESHQMEMNDLEEISNVDKSLEESKEKISGQVMTGTRKINEEYYKKTKGNPDYGKGTTNKEDKTKGSAGRNYTERFNDKTPHEKSSFEKLYNPERTELPSGITQIKGKIGKGPAGMSIKSRQIGAPSSGVRTSLKIAEEYVEYKAQSEEAVEKAGVPSKYKNIVKNYYESINPER